MRRCAVTAREGTARIQSVDRAVDLLLAVAAAGPAAAGVPALARVCGLNRATAWRLLKTLQARGMVAVDGTTGRVLTRADRPRARWRGGVWCRHRGRPPGSGTPEPGDR